MTEARPPRTDLQANQQNLIRRLNETDQKYQEYLQQMRDGPFNQYLSDDLDELRQQRRQQPYGTGFRKLYPGLLNYGLPEVYEILVNPEKISPLVENLKKENQQLKEELDLCSTDLDRYVQSTQKLIEENKNLVKHLFHKTVDAKRMAESLTLNESEEILDLKHQIELFKEENHHLIAHLHDSKRQQNEYTAQINNLKDQIKNAQALHEKLNFDFETSKSREEELAKTLTVLQQRFEILTQESARQKVDFVDLEKTNSYLRSQNQNQLERIDELERNMEEMQEEKNNKILSQSHHIYQLEINMDYTKKELQQLNSAYEDDRKKKFEYQMENSQLKSINDELCEERDQLKNQIALDMKRLEQSLLREEEYVKQINEHDENMVKYKRMLDEMQRESKMMRLANEEDLQDMSQKQKKHIEGLTRKFNETLKEKEDDLVELENKVHEQHKDIEALTEEIARQRTEITDLKQKQLDYNQVKRIVDQQSWELRRLHEEMDNMKQANEDMHDDNLKQEEIYKSEIEKLENDILNLSNMVDDQKIRIEQQHHRIKQYQIMQFDKEHLEKTIRELREENQDAMNQAHRSMRDLQIHNQERDILIKERDALKTQIVAIKRQQQQAIELKEENQELRQELNEYDKEVRRLKALVSIRDRKEGELERNLDNLRNKYKSGPDSPLKSSPYVYEPQPQQKGTSQGRVVDRSPTSSPQIQPQQRQVGTLYPGTQHTRQGSSTPSQQTQPPTKTPIQPEPTFGKQTTGQYMPTKPQQGGSTREIQGATLQRQGSRTNDPFQQTSSPYSNQPYMRK